MDVAGGGVETEEEEAQAPLLTSSTNTPTTMAEGEPQKKKKKKKRLIVDGEEEGEDAGRGGGGGAAADSTNKSSNGKDMLDSIIGHVVAPSHPPFPYLGEPQQPKRKRLRMPSASTEGLPRGIAEPGNMTKAASISDAELDRLRRLQRSINQEIQKRQKETPSSLPPSSSSSSSPLPPSPHEAKGSARQAILRGLDYLYKLARKRANFVSFGADIIMTLMDVASQSADEGVRRSALQRAELLGHVWYQAFPTLKEIARKKAEEEEAKEEEEEEEEEEDEGGSDMSVEEGGEGGLVGRKRRKEKKRKKRRKRRSSAVSILLSDDDEEEDEEEEEEEDDEEEEEGGKWARTSVHADPDKDDVNTAIRGLIVLSRLGLPSSTLAAGVRTYLENGPLKAKDFFRFHPRPRGEGWASSRIVLPRERPAFALAEAVDVSFYAGKVGMDLGATAQEVVPLLKQCRPYESCEEMGWDDWEDQLVMVTNTIHACSSFGELRLQAALFPHEYSLLKNKSTLRWTIKVGDAHLVGDICHCLGIFGVTPPSSSPSSSPSSRPIQMLLKEGQDFLLGLQNKDGSWPVRDETLGAYDLFLATSSAVGGLLNIRPQGWGPASASLAVILRRVNIAAEEEEEEGEEEREKEGGREGRKRKKLAPPSVTCCGHKRPLVLKKFERLALYYTKAAGEEKQEVVALPPSRPLSGSKGEEGGGEEKMKVGGVKVSQLLDASLMGVAGQALDELLHLYHHHHQHHHQHHQQQQQQQQQWLQQVQQQQVQQQQWLQQVQQVQQGGKAGSPTMLVGEDGEKEGRREGGQGKAVIVRRATMAARGLDPSSFQREYASYMGKEGGREGGGNSSGSATTKIPFAAGGVTLDLYELFQAVCGGKGGREGGGGMEGWHVVAKHIGIPGSVLDRARRVKDVYDQRLSGFEGWWVEEWEARGKRREVGRMVREEGMGMEGGRGGGGGGGGGEGERGGGGIEWSREAGMDQVEHAVGEMDVKVEEGGVKG